MWRITYNKFNRISGDLLITCAAQYPSKCYFRVNDTFGQHEATPQKKRERKYVCDKEKNLRYLRPNLFHVLHGKGMRLLRAFNQRGGIISCLHISSCSLFVAMVKINQCRHCLPSHFQHEYKIIHDKGIKMGMRMFFLVLYGSIFGTRQMMTRVFWQHASNKTLG